MINMTIEINLLGDHGGCERRIEGGCLGPVGGTGWSGGVRGGWSGGGRGLVVSKVGGRG